MSNALRTPRIALLLVLALSLPIAARADDASHRAKVQEMMSLLHTEKTVQLGAENIRKQVDEAAERPRGPDAPADAKAKVADFQKQAVQMIDAQIGWKVMQEQFITIYEKTFTEEQLDSIIAFYKSPAGVALLTNMPEVNVQISQFAQARIQALQPQLQQLYNDLRKSLAPAPPTLGPVSPAVSPVPAATTPK